MTIPIAGKESNKDSHSLLVKMRNGTDAMKFGNFLQS